MTGERLRAAGSSGSFARRTGLVAAGQGAVKAAQLVMAIVLVRLLAPAEWASTACLLSIYLAAVTIGTLNLQHGIVFFLPRLGQPERRALVTQAASLLAVSGALIAVALVIAAPVLGGGRLDVGRLVPWLGLAAALELPAAVVPPMLVASARFGLAAWWDVAGTAALIAATTLPAAAGHGAAGVVAGLLAVGALRLASAVALVGLLLPGRWRSLPAGTMRTQLRYGIPLGLVLAVSILNRLVDKWFVAAFDSAHFGIYAIAAQEVSLLAVLPYAGGAAIVVGLVRAFHAGDVGGAHAQWIDLTAAMSLVVVPVAAALILVAPELFGLVLPPAYAAAVLPFQVFTAITLHRVAEYGLLLRAAGRNRDLLATAVVTLTANVLLAGVGVVAFGMLGASFGTLVASGLGWWFALGRIASLLGVRFVDVFAWAQWLGALGLAAAGFFAALAVASFAGGGDLAALAVKLSVFVAVYSAGVAWVGSGWWRRPVDAGVGAAPDADPLDTPGRLLATGGPG